MPQVSWDQVNAGSDLVPGAIPEALQPHQAEPGSALDIAAAAFRQTNIASNLYDLATRPALPPAVEGYTPYAPGILTGYEDHLDRFVRSGSPAETEAIKGRIAQEQRDKQTLGDAGGWGLAASISAGVLDPATLLSMAIPFAAPVAWGSRSVRVGAAVAAGAALDTASEVAMHSAQETRTVGESAFNIGAGVFLNGIFGAIASRVPKSEFDVLRDNLAKDLNIPGVTNEQLAKAAREAGGVASTGGAAAVADATTLADETIATPLARGIAKTVGVISPLNRLMTSPFKQTRQLAQRLLEIPYLLNKNVEKGIANPLSVEEIAKARTHQARYGLITDYEKAFTEYSQRAAGEGAKNLRAFGEEVVAAMRNGDKSDIPEVAALAGKVRQTFDADRKALQELGVLPEELNVMGAESYFPRVYDHVAIAADPNGLRARLYGWFKANPRLPIGPGEVVSRIEEAPTEAARFFSEDADIFGKNGRSVVLRDRGNNEIGRLVYVERGGDTLQIARTQLAAMWKGQGLGQRMISELINEAERTGGKTVKSDQVVTADQLKAYWGLRKKGYGIEFADEEAVKKAMKDGTSLTVPGGVVRSMQSPQLILKILEKEQESAKAALKAAKKTATEGKQVSKEASRRFNRALRQSELLAERHGEVKAQGAPADTVARMEARIARNDERIVKAKQAAIEAEHDFGLAQAGRAEAGKGARTGARAVRAQREKAAAANRAAESAQKLNEKVAAPQFREPGEIESAVQETMDNILGTVRGMADLGGKLTPGAKPLRGRVLDVPDNVLAPYLVNDLETVMNGYFRSVVPQIEMRKAFGSASLNDEIQGLTDSVHAALARMENPKEIVKTREQLSKDINTLVAMRDRVLGSSGPKGDLPTWLVKANRVARSYNYVRLLGMQTLSSLSDYGHVVMKYGLVRTGAATAKFLTNISANKLVRADAKRLGTALDWTLDTRGKTLGDIGDELAGSKVERYAQWASHGFSRLSGMATWNASLKAITAALEQDHILRAVTNPEKMSKFQRGVMANSGFDEDMMKRVAAQYEKFGSDEEGLSRARTQLWDDAEAAKTVEASVVKAADLLVQTRGLGDLPIMMDNEIVKTLLQFKGFGMSSVNRIMIPMAQGLSHGDLASANGFAMMMTLGAMSYATREWASGREPDLSPRRVISEAANWSGVLGFLPDVYDPVAGAFNLPRLSRYASRTPIESLLGPSYGTATSLYNTSAQLFGPAPGAPASAKAEYAQSDLHRLRQLLPLQNLFYLRRVVNAVEGEVGEVTGAKGATHKNFVERVTETTPPEKVK